MAVNIPSWLTGQTIISPWRKKELPGDEGRETGLSTFLVISLRLVARVDSGNKICSHPIPAWTLFILVNNDKSLIIVNHFTYLDSNISSTESDINIHIEKKNRTTIHRLSTICKSNEREILPSCSLSILLYVCTIGTLTKCLEKKLDGNYTMMLHAVLNKSLDQHATKQQLYSHLLPISQTIQVRQTRHARHC